MPGDAVNHLVNAIRQEEEIEFVHVAHEESGSQCQRPRQAWAEARACMGTAGPGAIHLLNGLYDASKDRSPVVAITGQVRRDKLGINAHQEVDLHELFADVACYNQMITDPESAAAIIDEACRTAIARRQPAHVSLPDDVASSSALKQPEVGSARVVGLSPIHPPAEAIDEAVRLIAQAKRPLILAGFGALAVRDRVLQLAEQINAPIIKTLKAKALCPDEHLLTLGGLGLLGTLPAVLAMRGCDLLLMLGTDYPYPEFLNHDARIIQIDHEYASIGRRANVTLPIHGDCGLAVKALLDSRLEPADRHTWNLTRNTCSCGSKSWTTSSRPRVRPSGPRRCAA
ncbi:MAG: thiamine pyrophosphate-binding protein [Bryobacterales bacterium]